MNNPLVSVVMPAYNSERYIGEAIESVLAQTYAHWELIIVDDGSTDRTGAVADGYARRDSRIKVVHITNSGNSSARNVGGERARGDYIAVMDSDDISLPKRLELSVAAMSHHPEWVAMGGNAILFSDSTPERNVSAVCCDIERINREVLNRNPLMHSSVIIRADAYRRVGGYRTMFNAADDYDLWLRLSETGKLANIPDVLYMYRINPSGISMANAVSQGVGVCAARWASRARRTGRPDPIAKHDKITLEWMMERGLMAGWCYREIAKKLISSTAQTQHYGGPWTMVTARLEEARDWIYTHRVYTQFLPLWYYTVLIRQQHGVALTTAEKIWLRLLQFCRSAYRLLKP